MLSNVQKLEGEMSTFQLLFAKFLDEIDSSALQYHQDCLQLSLQLCPLIAMSCCTHCCLSHSSSHWHCCFFLLQLLSSHAQASHAQAVGALSYLHLQLLPSG